MRSVADRETSIELQVIAAIKGAFKSREQWEATFPDLAPIDDDWVMLQNWYSTVHRQGILLARLTVSPQTRAELETEMQDLIDRPPAWLNAHFQGQQVMTLELFFHGLAQTLATQRAAIERVVAEQVADPASIQEPLAEAPVPVGTEERGELLPGVTNAISAHLKALVDLAYNLETQAGWRFGPDWF
jgi:hypothetical protein